MTSLDRIKEIEKRLRTHTDAEFTVVEAAQYWLIKVDIAKQKKIPKTVTHALADWAEELAFIFYCGTVYPNPEKKKHFIQDIVICG